jgi:hypothetical protein
VQGTVREVRPGDEGRAWLDLELVETRDSDGEVCVEGTATLDVPLTWLAEGALS